MDLKKLRPLQGLSRMVYQKNKNSVFDIVLFGSSVKGKTAPRDIDVAVIFSSKIPQNKINKILRHFKGFHAEYVFLSELYKETMWPTILQESYSLIHSEFVYKTLGFESSLLFVYDLKKLDGVSKSRFSHALFGRVENTGVLYEAGGKQMGRGCISVPIEKSEKIRSFFETWKISYSVHKALLF